MTGRESSPQFREDPLRFLDQAFVNAADAIWLPGRQLCLAEPAAARAVLANADGLYQEHSDFFFTRRGILGPRAVQVEIGRSSRTMLRAYLRTHADKLPDRIQQMLVPTSAWPDAGNWFTYRYLAPVLVTPDSSARLLRTLDAIVERSVLAGAREQHSRLRRAVYRFCVMRELVRAVNERRSQHTGQPADILDIVVNASGPEVPADELAEVFLSFVFAIAGSVGFVLGWSLYLLGTHPPTDVQPAWVVREALRLWPVAWMLGRSPSQGHEIGGVFVTPQDEVVVCPYLVHRHPRHWDDPSSFRPERWATAHDHTGFIPFGAGPHTCVAASLSMQLVEDILQIIIDNYRMILTPYDTHPHTGPALAPPRFALGLIPH